MLNEARSKFSPKDNIPCNYGIECFNDVNSNTVRVIIPYGDFEEFSQLSPPLKCDDGIKTVWYDKEY